MRKHKIIAFILVICFLLPTFPIYSQNPSDTKKLQQDRKAVDGKINLIRQQQAQKERQKKSLSEQVEELEIAMYEVEQELEIIEEELSEVEGRAAITQREYDRAVDEAAKQKELLNKRVRVMYQTGPMGYLSVLLDSSSFGDFVSRMDLLSKVINHDVTILQEREVYRKAVEDKKKQLEKELEEKERLRAVVLEKVEEAEFVRKERQATLENVFKDLKELEKLEDKLLEESARLARLIMANQSGGDYIGGEMTWPAPGYTGLSSQYGLRFHPILKVNRMHAGIDINVPMGKDIVAANDGKVILSGVNGGYGNCIIIDHGGKISTLYGHNSKLLVKVGDTVTRGQVIAKCGSTGLSTGPHLHFEVRINGVHTDPLPYLRKK